MILTKPNSQRTSLTHSRAVGGALGARRPLLSFLGLLGASPALAQTSEPSSLPAAHPAMVLASWQLSTGLFVLLLIVAFLVNRFNSTRRHKVRTTLFMFGFHLLSSALSVVLRKFEINDWSERALVVSHLFVGFTLVHMAALAIFDVVLVKIGIVMTGIAAELLVAAGYIISFVVVLSQVGVDATGLLTASTVVTAVVGLSLQQTLGNILGGVALQIDNSISVGDWIQMVPGGPRMKVSRVGWRHTVAETGLLDTVVLPNAQLLASQFTVLGKFGGKSSNRVAIVEFSVPLKYSPDVVCDIVQEAIRSSPILNVSQEPEPSLCVCLDYTRLGFRGLAVYAAAFCVENIAGELTAASRVRRRIYCALKRNNIPLGEQPAPTEEELQKQRIEKESAIRSVEIFKSLSSEEQKKLAEQLIYAPFSEGEAMTKQGTQARSLGILTKGTAEVRIEREGVEKIITTLSAPTFFGEMALLTGAMRAASVVATSNVECYRLEKEAFHQVLQERPEIAKELSELLAHRKSLLNAATYESDEERDEQPEAEVARQMLRSIQKFFGLS